LTRKLPIKNLESDYKEIEELRNKFDLRAFITLRNSNDAANFIDYLNEVLELTNRLTPEFELQTKQANIFNRGYYEKIIGYLRQLQITASSGINQFDNLENEWNQYNINQVIKPEREQMIRRINLEITILNDREEQLGNIFQANSDQEQ
jgi:hypothetical protein